MVTTAEDEFFAAEALYVFSTITNDALELHILTQRFRSKLASLVFTYRIGRVNTEGHASRTKHERWEKQLVERTRRLLETLSEGSPSTSNLPRDLISEIAQALSPDPNLYDDVQAALDYANSVGGKPPEASDSAARRYLHDQLRALHFLERLSEHLNVLMKAAESARGLSSIPLANDPVERKTKKKWSDLNLLIQLADVFWNATNEKPTAYGEHSYRHEPAAETAFERFVTAFLDVLNKYWPSDAPPVDIKISYIRDHIGEICESLS